MKRLHSASAFGPLRTLTDRYACRHLASGRRRCLRSPGPPSRSRTGACVQHLFNASVSTRPGRRPRMGPPPAGTTTALWQPRWHACDERRLQRPAAGGVTAGESGCTGRAGGSGVRAQAPFAVASVPMCRRGVEAALLARGAARPRGRAGERTPGPAAQPRCCARMPEPCLTTIKATLANVRNGPIADARIPSAFHTSRVARSAVEQLP